MAEHTTDALIDKADMLTITDKLGAIYSIVEPALSTASTGAIALADDILAAIMAVTDPDEYYVELDLLSSAKSLGDGLTVDTVLAQLCQGMVTALNTHCQQRAPLANPAISSIVAIDSFATYWNGAGTFSDVLYSPGFQALYYACMAANLSVANCYSTAIEQGGTYTNAMGKYVVGTSTFTDGAAVDTTKYGMAMPKLMVSEEITKSGESDIVITVTGVDHEGTADEEWTYTSAAAISAGDYDFAEVASKWIRDVTGIAITGAAAGTFYVEGWKPTARP